MKVLQFKAVSPLFEMGRSGEKPFTVRKIDHKDEWFKTILERFKQETLGDDLVVRTVNPATGESFCRRLTGVEYIRPCPLWLILYLGEEVDNGSTD